MSKQKMIKVPFMKMPECCDKCDFGRLRFSHPSWSKDEKVGKHGYNCQLEYYEKGRYETVREAPVDEHIVPILCPLIKANGLENNLLSEMKDTERIEKLEKENEYRGESDCRECKAEHECYECEKYEESEES